MLYSLKCLDWGQMCGNMVRDELLVIALFGRGIEMERGLVMSNGAVSSAWS